MSQGKLAMLGGGRWPLPNFRNLDYVDKLGIVPWPQREERGSPVGWSTYAVMQESQNKEAAWEFAKFMTTKEVVKLWAELGGVAIPPRQSVQTSDAFH